MKATSTALTLFTVILLNCYACQKKERGCTDLKSINYNSNAEEDDGSCEYFGKAMFYTNADHGCGFITVLIYGISQTITSKTDVTPVCGDSAGVTFQLGYPGKYEFIAEDSCHTWHNFVHVENNGCSKVRLI